MSTTPTGAATEPALVRGAIVSLIIAILALLGAFGVELSDEQRDAIIGLVTAVAIFVAIVGPFVTGWLIRRKVTPSVQVVAQLDGTTGEVVAGEASPLPTGLILEPGATVEDITP